MRIIASFIISIIGAFTFSGFFYNIVPGGNSDVKIVIGLVVFIVGEIAVYANIILDKLDEINGSE